MKLTEIISGMGFLAFIALVIAFFWGYIENIFKLIAAPEFALMEIIRIIGLIVPFVGAIVGYVG